MNGYKRQKEKIKSKILGYNWKKCKNILNRRIHMREPKIIRLN